jgi:hypothetical protein
MNRKIHIRLRDRQGHLRLEQTVLYRNMLDAVRKIACVLLSFRFIALLNPGSRVSLDFEEDVAKHPAQQLHVFDSEEVQSRLEKVAADNKDKVLVRCMFVDKKTRKEAASSAGMSDDGAKKRLQNMYQNAFEWQYNFIKGQKHRLFYHYLLTGSTKVPVSKTGVRR